MEPLDNFGGDRSFIDEYMGLVKSIAGRYSRYGVSFDDLVQEGIMGLFEAKEKFDEKRGVKFSTFAFYFIKGRVLKYLQNEKKVPIAEGDPEQEELKEPVNAPVTKKGTDEKECFEIPTGFPETERKVLVCLYVENKSLREIAEILGYTRERTRQLKQKALRRLRINRKLTEF